jgi:hypothetical protein
VVSTLPLAAGWVVAAVSDWRGADGVDRVVDTPVMVPVLLMRTEDGECVADVLIVIVDGGAGAEVEREMAAPRTC